LDGLFAGIGLAITASIFLNVGKGVQKWKVKTLAHGRKVLTREHRRDFVIWLAGILMTTSATIFYSAALKFTDKSSMVSAFNGVGMIGLVLFAWLVLKEKIGRQELGGAALILIGTGLLTLAALSVRARPVVTIAATLASGLLTLLLLVWGIWATTHGFFALLPFITAALCGASTLLLSVSLPAVLRVSAARRALLAD